MTGKPTRMRVGVRETSQLINRLKFQLKKGFFPQCARITRARPVSSLTGCNSKWLRGFAAIRV